MIGVQSYLELFSTLIGWAQYNTIWNMLVGSGLICLPFLIVLVSNSIAAMKSDKGIGAFASSGITNKIFAEVLGVCIVIMIFGTPLIKLEAKALSFVPVCQDSGKYLKATPGNTGTTYDTAFSGQYPNSVLVPPAWYVIIAISEGISRWIKAEVPCAKQDFRQIHTSINTDTIKDPALKKDVSVFFELCYLNAIKKHMGEMKAGLKQQLGYDLESLSSKYYLSTPGYYDALTLPNTLPGIRVDPKYNRNTCRDWWMTEKTGLRARLSNEVDPGFVDYVRGLGNREKAIDGAIDKLVKNTVEGRVNGGFQDNSSSMWDGKNTLSGIGAFLGVQWTKLSYYPKMQIMIQSLPILQSLLLLIMYAILPLFMIAARFNLKKIVIYAFCLSSVIFWPCWWHFAEFVDRAMIHAFFPTAELWGSGNVQFDLLDMVATLMYIVFPLVITALMGLSGIPATGYIAAATGMVASQIGVAGDNAMAAGRAVVTAGRSGVGK